MLSKLIFFLWFFAPEISGTINEYPWAASIVQRHGSTKDLIKPGILITPQLILTGELYLPSTKIAGAENYVAVVGTNIYGSLDNTTAQIIPVAHFRLQPGFQRTTWPWANNDMSLVHLAHPVSSLQPVSLPKTLKEIKEITEINPGNPLFITGWADLVRDGLYAQEMAIPEEKECRKLWEDKGETENAPYEHRYCAQVNENNANQTKCILRDNGAVRLINGSYFLAGFVNQYFSTNVSGVCYKGALYFIWNFNLNDFQWIQQNIRCGSHNFTCDNGQCTNLSNVCNDVEDCADGSDEGSLICKGTPDNDGGITTFNIIAGSLTLFLIVLLFTAAVAKMYQININKARMSDTEPLLHNSAMHFDSRPPPKYFCCRSSIRLMKNEPIDTGSSSTVWKVYDEVRQIGTALKQMDLYDLLTLHKWNEGLVYIEQNHLARITSSNVVQLIDAWGQGPEGEQPISELIASMSPNSEGVKPIVGPSSCFYFLQLELCDGSLHQWLKENPTVESRMQRQNFGEKFQQIVNGLKSIHSEDVIHRDIYPKNILYKIEKDLKTQEDKIIWKIADLGLSWTKELGDGSFPSDSAGCLNYRSPEMLGLLLQQQKQLHKDVLRRYCKKTDVFSLGLTFMEVLLPFQNRKELILQFDKVRSTHEGHDLRRHFQGLRDDLQWIVPIVCKMLIRDPEQRPDIFEINFIRQ